MVSIVAWIEGKRHSQRRLSSCRFLSNSSSIRAGFHRSAAKFCAIPTYNGRVSMLSPRLQLKVAQKQVLTPGLVQMVTVLQLNRMELKAMINQEIVENPVLEELLEEGEEITPEELQPLLEAERSSDPADQSLLDAADIKLDGDSPEVIRNTD